MQSSYLAMRQTRMLAALVVASISAACHRAVPTIESPAPASSERMGSGPMDPTVESSGQAEHTGGDAPELADDAARRARARAILGQIVYFQFDRSDLDGTARLALDEKAEVLRADATLQVRIEGHADDRGSDEYNLALGMGRAAAVKRYLADRGIAQARMETATLGEERPACRGSDESCWSRNRRAEFVVQP